MVDSIRWKNEEAKTAAVSQSKSREHWLDDVPSKEAVSLEINTLLAKMHGRKRTEERMKISKAVRDREIKRKANKIGSVIQTVVGKSESTLTCHGLGSHRPARRLYLWKYSICSTMSSSSGMLERLMP